MTFGCRQTQPANTLPTTPPCCAPYESYPKGLAVGSNVGWGPVGHALDVQGLSLVESVFLWWVSPVMKQTVHLQQLTGRQRSLDTHPTKKRMEMWNEVSNLSWK